VARGSSRRSEVGFVIDPQPPASFGVKLVAGGAGRLLTEQELGGTSRLLTEQRSKPVTTPPR
jgi:hypothetical protein